MAIGLNLNCPPSEEVEDCLPNLNEALDKEEQDAAYIYGEPEEPGHMEIGECSFVVTSSKSFMFEYITQTIYRTKSMAVWL